jgi:hypothetical protein
MQVIKLTFPTLDCLNPLLLKSIYYFHLMATYRNSVYGTIKGTLAENVAYVRKGTKCVRSSPQSYNDANTDQQKKARGKFSTLVQMSAIFTPLINIGLKGAATNSTEQNVFTSINKNTVSINPDLSININYNDIKVANGTIEGTNGSMLATIAGTTLTVTWIPSTDPTRNNDVAYFGMRIAELAGLVTELSLTARSTGTKVINLPVPTGSPLHVWMFFKDSVTGKTSTSTAVTATVL